MYDDFREIAPGALDELQDYLNDNVGVRQLANESAASNTHSMYPASSGESSEKPSHNSHLNPAKRKSSGEEPNLPRGLRRRNQGRRDCRETSSAIDKMWVLPIFQQGRHRTKVKHLHVDSKMSDYAFFTLVKSRYYEETSKLKRFLAMRSVAKISYVKVRHMNPT